MNMMIAITMIPARRQMRLVRLSQRTPHSSSLRQPRDENEEERAICLRDETAPFLFPGSRNAAIVRCASSSTYARYVPRKGCGEFADAESVVIATSPRIDSPLQGANAGWYAVRHACSMNVSTKEFRERFELDSSLRMSTSRRCG